MFKQIVGKALAGIFLTGLFSAGVQAVDEPVPMKQVDRSKLSESFRNTAGRNICPGVGRICGA